MEMSPWLAVCLPATPDDERDLRLRTFIRPNGMEATTLIGTRVMDPIGEIPADLLQHNSKDLVCTISQLDRRHLPGQENDAKWTYSRYPGEVNSFRFNLRQHGYQAC